MKKKLPLHVPTLFKTYIAPRKNEMSILETRRDSFWKGKERRRSVSPSTVGFDFLPVKLDYLIRRVLIEVRGETRQEDLIEWFGFTKGKARVALWLLIF